MSPSRRGELSSAALAAGSLIAGYGVVAASGSRPLGGIVLLAGGLACVRIWLVRHGRRTAIDLAAAMFAAFVLSHLLALAIGAWPAVLVCAALTGGTVAVRAGRLGEAPLARRAPGGASPAER